MEDKRLGMVGKCFKRKMANGVKYYIVMEVDENTPLGVIAHKATIANNGERWFMANVWVDSSLLETFEEIDKKTGVVAAYEVINAWESCKDDVDKGNVSFIMGVRPIKGGL